MNISISKNRTLTIKIDTGIIKIRYTSILNMITKNSTLSNYNFLFKCIENNELLKDIVYIETIYNKIYLENGLLHNINSYAIKYKFSYRHDYYLKGEYIRIEDYFKIVNIFKRKTKLKLILND